MTDFSLAGFLLSLAGAAALLIWSVRLVRTGVERAFGRQLRGWMARSARSRLTAAGSGVVAALLLQSATAVLVLVAEFSRGGALPVAAGTAVILGADLGSAIVVGLISLHASDAMPLLILLGVLLFLKGKTSTIRQVGRILIGLALIFVSLMMIRDASEPLIGHDGVSLVLNYLGNDPFSAFLLGALLAWLVHSSVATVLLVVSLAGHGLLGAGAATAIVLGANFVGCLIAFGLTLGAPGHVRAIVYSNMMARGGSAIFLLLLFSGGVLSPDLLGTDPALAIINLHIAFNFLVLVAFLPVAGLLSRLADRTAMMFSPPGSASIDRLPAVEEFLLTPMRAVQRIRRELVNMGQMVEAMQREALPLLFHWNAARAAEISETAGTLRERHVDLKLLASGLNQQAASTQPEILDAIADLMQIGTAIEGAVAVLSGDLLVVARDLAGRDLHFSHLGQNEILGFAEKIAQNMELALLAIEREDPAVAVELIGRKAEMRKLEQSLQKTHMTRLAQRNAQSMSTSSQHQDVLRSLKQVNSHIANVGNVLLVRRGELNQTRLVRH